MAATITVTVEVAFDGSTFIDVSQYARRVTIKYGRERLIEDAFQAGSCTIEVDNRTNWLTPGHSDSTYGNTQLINREVRVRSVVSGGADSYPTYLWRGFITDLNYVAEQSTSTVFITSVDGFSRLAAASIYNQTFSEEYTGIRVANVLDLASVDYPDESSPALDRDIDYGSIKASAATGVTATALDYIQQLARTENGRFLINQAGTPSATNKGGVASYYAVNAPTVDHGITVSDAVTLATGSVEAAHLALEWGSELLYNSYEFTPASGAVQTGSNAASITKYGERVIKRTLLSDTGDSDEAGIYFIGLFDEPALRVSQVIIAIDSATTLTAEKLLHLQVMSAMDLSYLPPGSSATLASALVVEGVALDITVRDMATNSARITGTYSTSSADRTGYWILGDAVQSTLPTTLAPSWLDTTSWRLDDPDRGVLPTELASTS